MRGFKQFLAGLRRKVFHREDLLPAGGIPYVLGQGLSSPCIEPGLTVHWHPPFSVIAAEEQTVEKNRFRTLLARLGIKRKSA